MKFQISRTSNYDSSVMPVEGAKFEKVWEWHTRTCDEQTFNERHAQREGLWRSKGKNHTTTKEGHITRMQEREAWVVEIDTLEALIEFVKKHGEIILSCEDRETTFPELEIYDDYRE